MKHVAIAGQGVDRNQAFYKQIFQLDKESEAGGAGDEGAKLLSHAILHELGFLPLHQLALRVRCAAFRFRALVGDGRELLGREGVS